MFVSDFGHRRAGLSFQYLPLSTVGAMVSPTRYVLQLFTRAEGFNGSNAAGAELWVF